MTTLNKLSQQVNILTQKLGQLSTRQKRQPRNKRKNRNKIPRSIGSDASLQYAMSLLRPDLESGRIIDNTSVSTGTFHFSKEGLFTTDPNGTFGLKLNICANPTTDRFTSSSPGVGTWGNNDPFANSSLVAATGTARVVSAAMLVQSMESGNTSLRAAAWFQPGNWSWNPGDFLSQSEALNCINSVAVNLTKNSVLIRWFPTDNSNDEFTAVSSPRYNGQIGFIAVSGGSNASVHAKWYINIEYIPKADTLSSGIEVSPSDSSSFGKIRSHLSSLSPFIIGPAVDLATGLLRQQARRLLQ